MFFSDVSSGSIPASRDVIRVAAVIGREFPRRVLERVIPDVHRASTIVCDRYGLPS